MRTSQNKTKVGLKERFANVSVGANIEMCQNKTKVGLKGLSAKGDLRAVLVRIRLK